jgi:hypothetical protein
VLVLSSGRALPPRILPKVACVESTDHEAKVEPVACAVSVVTGTTVNVTEVTGQDTEAVTMDVLSTSVPFKSTFRVEGMLTLCATTGLMVRFAVADAPPPEKDNVATVVWAMVAGAV